MLLLGPKYVVGQSQPVAVGRGKAKATVSQQRCFLLGVSPSEPSPAGDETGTADVSVLSECLVNVVPH